MLLEYSDPEPATGFFCFVFKNPFPPKKDIFFLLWREGARPFVSVLYQIPNRDGAASLISGLP